MIFQSHGKMQDYAELFDSDRKDNEQPSGRFATIKEKKNPETVVHHGWRMQFFVHMDLLLPFAILPEADQSIFLSSAFSHKRQSSTYR